MYRPPYIRVRPDVSTNALMNLFAHSNLSQLNIYLATVNRLFRFNNASGPSNRCFSSLILSFHLSLV
jgi:hypothetical protein